MLLLSNWGDVDPEEVTLALADVFLGTEDVATAALSMSVQANSLFRAPT